MAKDTFRPINQTISEIFNVDGIYKIPNYQRQYSWGVDQLDALWGDLYEAYENKSLKNDCYFLGSIVVVDNQNGYYELIDGQQRLTTLMILMNVLLKDYKEINNNSEELFAVDKEKIESCVKFQNKKNRLQLQTDPKYDTIFNEVITDKETFSNMNYPSKANLRIDDPRYKYINTAVYFYNKLNDLDDEERNGLVNYIFFNTNIIKIECTNQSFAIKLFQVLNDRGLDLSPSDMVKSYIIGKYEDDDEIGKNIFNNTWKNIEDLAKEYDFNIDDFIIYYEYFKIKSNPKRQVVDELKSIIESAEVYQLVNEISSFTESLKKVYKSTDPVILSLRYIPWKFYVMTALTSAYQVDYPDKEKLFKLMRRFFYIALTSGATLSRIKQTSFKLIEYIVDKKSIEEIEVELNKTIIFRKMIKDTYENLNDYVYNEKYLKPLMLSLEYELREKTNTTFYSIDKNLHMDHILPKAYGKKKEWDHIEDDQAAKVINGIGNMALLISDKNEEALNCGFLEKKKIYNGEGNVKGGITTFETSRLILEESEWNIDTIIKRRKYLIKKIEKMLDISEEQKDLVLKDEYVKGSRYKWEYKSIRYDNVNLILRVIYDYIKDMDFKSFNEIPEEVRNFKMHSHEIIIEDNNPLLENYSYYSKKDTNFNYNIRNICLTDDTKNFLAILKKHYDLDITLLYE